MVGVSDSPGFTKGAQFYDWKCCISATRKSLHKNINSDPIPIDKNESILVKFVDLPGYGFAYTNPEVQAKWASLIKNILDIRRGKRSIACLLLDSRHGFKQIDREFVQENFEKMQIPFRIVLTKADLVSPPDLARQMETIFQVFF